MSERIIRVDGIELATEPFGDPADVPVLLIMGVAASMLWWPEEFCARLSEHGRYVIRYDHRDTGHSTAYPTGAPGYSLDDLADDAIRVLDGYGLVDAHIVGMSLGGMLGQMIARTHPTRVLTLTTISSSPLGTDKAHLPGASAAYNAYGATGEDVDWSNRAQVIDFLLGEARISAGAGRPFAEADVRAFVERDYDRSGGYLSTFNHAMLTVADIWRGELEPLRQPLLVIHGTDDPVYPVEHGIALAQSAPGSTFVRLEGSGHELHPADWDTIIDAIVAHTASR
jgi:pimeloyl-ACP methyl ester carboxylesterase